MPQLKQPIVAFPPLRWGEPCEGVIWKNERCIEIPLSLDVLRPHEPGTVLDAGCTMNGLMSPMAGTAVTHVTLTLGNEPQYPHPNRAYVEADLRDLSQFADQSFERVGCLSTLEHIGCDNSAYGGPIEQDPASVARAVRELWRVCGDTLMITVPFRVGAADQPRWRYFTPETWREQVLAHIPIDETRYRDTAYYTHTHLEKPREGYWSGPYPEPVAHLQEPDLGRPEQIAVLVARR